VGAVHEALAIDDRSGPEARPAELIEGNAGSDDIDDRIDGADFVKVDFGGRDAVNLAFGLGDTFENGEGAILDPVRKAAALDKGADIGVAAAMLVLIVMMVVVVVAVMAVIALTVLVVMVIMLVMVLMGMTVCVSMFVLVVLVAVTAASLGVMIVVVLVMVVEVNIEFDAFDAGLEGANSMEVEFAEAELFEFVLQNGEVDTEIEQGADEHIAADAAEDIEIERFHELGKAGRTDDAGRQGRKGAETGWVARDGDAKGL